MFNCSICKRTSQPGETQNKVVVARRNHDHPQRDDAYPRHKNALGEKVTRDDPGGRGMQITQEVNACSHCALTAKFNVSVPLPNGVRVNLPTFSAAFCHLGAGVGSTAPDAKRAVS